MEAKAVCVYRVWWLQGGLGKADDPVITSAPLVKQTIAVMAHGTHSLFFHFHSAVACSASGLFQPLISLSSFFLKDKQLQLEWLGFARQRVR